MFIIIELAALPYKGATNSICLGYEQQARSSI